MASFAMSKVHAVPTARGAISAKAPLAAKPSFLPSSARVSAAAPTLRSSRVVLTRATTEAEAEPPAAPAPSAGANTIVSTAAGIPDFSTLVAAVGAAELADALSAEGPFTVFAPKNSAFAKFLEQKNLSKTQLLAGEDALKALLTYHVVEGKVMSKDLQEGMEPASLSGRKLQVSLAGGAKVNGVAIVEADIEVGNGVIHIVEDVLVPPFTYPANFQQPADIGGFEGWMPEVVNGRAAMIGFVLAVAGEISNHEAFLSQIGSHGGALAKAAAVITFASIVPSMHSSIGYTGNPETMADSPEWKEAFKGGFVPFLQPVFTPEVEKLNGRAAMVGIAALVVAEAVTGSALL